MKIVAAIVAACLLAAPAAFAAKPAEPVKVIYHLNLGLEQASDGLRNIRNHLSVDPTARIVVVTHSKGVDFLLAGAKDDKGNPYEAAVDDLSLKGVEFRVCNITLTSRKIDPKLVHPAATIVPSGVAEVSRLQAQENFVYLKP